MFMGFLLLYFGNEFLRIPADECNLLLIVLVVVIVVVEVIV